MIAATGARPSLRSTSVAVNVGLRCVHPRLISALLAAVNYGVFVDLA